MHHRKSITGYAIAADIGGTNMRAALVSRAGEVVSRHSAATTPERGIEDAAGRLGDLVAQARKDASGETIVGIGVSTAGPIDPSSGTYNHPPNLTGWHGRTMRPLLGKVTGLNVWIGHDATLAALAETRYGEHQGAKNLVYVTISTGIGAGIFANGEMVTGSTGGAGEAGHVTVRPGGLRCNVGCDGCFEGNASGPAIARMAAAKVRSGEKTRLHGDPAHITSREVFEAAAAGDAMAQHVLDTAIENIGIGLGGLLNILDPEALVIGGGVVEGLKPWMGRVKAAVQTHSLPRYKERGVPLSVTRLGDDASLLGAAVLAFHRADTLD